MFTLEEATARSTEIYTAYRRAKVVHDNAQKQLADAKTLLESTMSMARTVFTTYWGNPMLAGQIDKLREEAAEGMLNPNLSAEERQSYQEMSEMLEFIGSYGDKAEE